MGYSCQHFAKKIDSHLQLFENELLSLTQGNLAIKDYFTKVKSLCHEIFELDPNSKIIGPWIIRKIIHELKPKHRSVATITQGWATRLSIEELENSLANQEELAKQTLGVMVKNEEEASLNKKVS